MTNVDFDIIAQDILQAFSRQFPGEIFSWYTINKICCSL